MRIDNDIDIMRPVNFNPFEFLEMNKQVLGIRHWSMDPLEICGGIYPPTELYLREMPDYISAQRSNIRLPPKCYCGGGSTYFAYAPWFRTPQYKTYWKFIECLGGVWTHRWAEQNLIPMSIALLADNPEKRYQYFTNIAVNHRGGLLQPHSEWGVPRWPYPPPDGTDKTVVSYPAIHHRRGCIIYYIDYGEVGATRRSLANLEFHFLRFHSYPIYIFYREGGLSADDEMLLVKAVNPDREIFFFKTKVQRLEFNLKELYTVLEFRHKEYGYFMLIHPFTNILADIHWDPFVYMEHSQFTFAFHRLNPVPLEPVSEHPQLWDLAQPFLANATKKSKLPPVNFGYALYYLVMGKFSFFQAPEYQAFAAAMPVKQAKINHVFPLAVSLFGDEPWKRVGDISWIQLNFGSSSSVPIHHRSWWEQSTPPTFPFRYSNKSPPS
jgi:hypothetical protein